MTGFVILSAFSNCILSTTIRSSYNFIDSIEDLKAREDLITLVHLSEAQISLIRVLISVFFKFYLKFKIR